MTVAKYHGEWSAEEIDAGLAGGPYEVSANLPFRFPWRIVSVTDSPADHDLPYSFSIYSIDARSDEIERVGRAFFTPTMRVVVSVDGRPDLVKVRDQGKLETGGMLGKTLQRSWTWETGPLVFTPRPSDITVRGLSIRRDDDVELVGFDYSDGVTVPAGHQFEFPPHSITLQAAGDPGVMPRLEGAMFGSVLEF